MDYEKAYKESFEAAKGLHDAGNALTKMQMEIIFPELAESEDERIRETLIHIVKGACDKYGIKYRGDDITEEKLLVYLEKQKEQKEQKPVPPLPPFDEMTPEDKMNHPLYLEGFDTGREVQKVFDEQKPAEWSEEDEDNLCRVIRVLEDNDSDWKELSNWLKSLRPSWKPSEEQMNALDKAIPVCMGVVGRDEIAPLESLYEQLKKL